MPLLVVKTIQFNCGANLFICGLGTRGRFFLFDVRSVTYESNMLVHLLWGTMLFMVVFLGFSNCINDKPFHAKNNIKFENLRCVHSYLQLGQRDVSFLSWLKQSDSQMLINYLNYTNIQKGTQNDVVHSSWIHMDSFTTRIPMRYLMISIMYFTCHHVQTTFKSILKHKKIILYGWLLWLQRRNISTRKHMITQFQFILHVQKLLVKWLCVLTLAFGFVIKVGTW
jgi:hypothetical protein